MNIKVKFLPLPCRQTCPEVPELQESPEVLAVPELLEVPAHHPVRPCQANLWTRAVRPSRYGQLSRGCRPYQELLGLLDLLAVPGFLELRHDLGHLGDPGVQGDRDTEMTDRISPQQPHRNTGDLR